MLYGHRKTGGDAISETPTGRYWGGSGRGVIGAALGWVMSALLIPHIGPDWLSGVVILGVFLVLMPLIAYLEMAFFWDRSRFELALRRLRRSPPVGMGIIALASLGVEIGLGMGWGLPTLG